jgi:hypothetical protein
MSTPQELEKQMTEKTEQELQTMFARPDDWTPEELNAARAELQKRNIPVIEPVLQEAWTKQNVLEVAKFQKWVIWMILISLVAMFIPFATIVTGIIQLYFIFKLATALRLSAWGYIIMAFIPLIGLIALLHLNGKATKKLKASGIRVGLMGARMEDF